ncbi:proton-coupled amino acid transporter 1 [Fopius arisanus]|uniref:Proton-coupled amino acid transporter 1 n=1 Tax=Fopius arisanus TaxID=64838 RepID=A0A0C9QI83_9HYME|nr:PREDICTED: proton-coupled amino acid transporter 1 [Fopius arisanus]XP_011300218.1 PREDICTED: proton-coupled amino acid transporter 1 [Fopius arisanus]XP_011300219.1 PREDICTED: proton-coupled amino acid transporter 1 [Fopius arisanus]XP_011300220.1 PREDICTED: proton-coupled amino acid transporter 1 [Fopius arisanus]
MDHNNKVPTELDEFLPTDGSNFKDGVLTAKYKVQVTPRDAEVGLTGKEFNPFTERRHPNPTTDCDTLTHLLKASLGTGILAMPCAFRSAGLIVGIFATFFVAFVCTHCAYILVKCAHVLYHKTRRTEMSFADIAEASLAHGPSCLRGFSKPSRYLIQISLFITYFGTCSVYAVIVAANFREIINHYMYPVMTAVNSTQEALFNQTYNITTAAPAAESVGGIDERMTIACLLLPLILLTWIPDLKYLAPVSMIANLFMATGLGITFYYLVIDLPPVDTVPYVKPLTEFPKFFSITIFAMEAIGVVMPLENQMKTPQHFVGIFGVLSKGMSGVTLIYILLGFLGYLKYPNSTAEIITQDLPIHEIPAQIVKLAVALAVFCTFGLQFYVCLDIAWSGLKDRFTKKPLLANYIVRTGLVTGCVLLAVAVPTIAPLIGLIGAFCFSILGILIPVAIEIITCWDVGFGKCNWIIMKNVVIIFIGVMALIFGSKDSIEGIIKAYTPTN